ncbi:hypothetical protein PR048_016084 [Dryococelus australis]|uniref:HAT C-terminal dimerisation domain-containing protein n=1 Tax=Dryococelus australis TaxID=614101 RepID=A0ABQ9HJ07_9NEOP|nr:hypothetical protein PR048_016084 [Dryococelus australis]
MSVVWHCFASLYKHFSASKDDKSRSPTERAMYSGLIRRCIIFIDNDKEKPGNKCLEARVVIKEGNLCGVTLIENIKISTINPLQLLASRLFTTISINEPKSTSGSVHTNSKQEEYDTLLKELKLLERNQWPSEKPPGLGEIEIERLSRVSKELNLLFNCVKQIPCSSAECERAFSQMDLVISPT